MPCHNDQALISVIHGCEVNMARKGSGSKKRSKASSRNARRLLSPKVKTGRPPKRSRRLSPSQESERVRALDAANLYRQGKAKTVSAAARMAGNNLNAMWRWVPLTIEKDPR